MGECQVVIIGAGPYGLSIAAHLKALGVNFRIFGSPMHTWKTQMPQGMQLKSEGFASSLYDPASSFTLGDYCRERGLSYADTGLPVPLETFIAYGSEFQKRFVPELENKLVVAIDRLRAGFRIVLDDGEEIVAGKVVIAVGISHFSYLPSALEALPREFVTHSSQHNALRRFAGREVAVIGAGASALDVAALLHQAGAAVQLIARKPAIRFHDPPGPKPRTWLDRARLPRTGIGPGWKLYFCAYTPWAFPYFPEEYRLRAVKKILGPAPGWFIKQHVVGKFPFHLGTNIADAKVRNGKVHLDLASADASKTLVVDHMIAATGYRVDLQRLEFLDADFRSKIRSVEKSPVLSANFESSIPGLYFVGTSAANTFGPLMRFAYGARFAAQRVSTHLAKVSPTVTPGKPQADLAELDREELSTR